MAKTEPATSFESILDQRADEVERPKPLPAGTYDVLVKGMPEHGQSSKQKTPFVRFTYVLQAAGEDVDEADLAELLTNARGETVALSERSIRDTYYTTPRRTLPPHRRTRSHGHRPRQQDGSRRP